MVECNEDYGALQAVLEHGKIDVNCRNRDGLTALHVACVKNRDVVVRILMSREDLDVNATAAFDLTPLHLAARLGYDRVVKELVNDECRLFLHAKTIHDFTALHLVAEGDEEFSGPYLNSRRSSVEQRSVVVALLRAEQEKRGLIGFENNGDVLGRTALHYAARNGYSEMVRELLEFSYMNPNVVDSYGLTPLHLAVQKGHVKVSRLLMQAHNIDLNYRSGVRNVRLHGVSLLSDDDLKMRLLYPVLCDDKPSETGVNVTPVHMAAGGSHFEILSSLLSSRCIDLRAVDCRGFTALHFAVAYGDIRVVILLTDQSDIDVNCCDFEGRTPLLLSVVQCRLEILKALLGDDGAAIVHMPEHLLHRAMNLLAIATQQGSSHRAIAHYLIDCLEDSVRDFEGCPDSTLVHWAAKNGNTELIELVLTWKPEVMNATDEKKQTPLHLATIHGHTELVQRLCNEGSWCLRAAEVDKCGATPLDYAFEQGKKSREIQKLLLRRGDVKEYMERIYRLDMNTMNALFVGATLLASVTYVGWMQPPLGFMEDYRYPLQSPPAPPDTYAVFIDFSNDNVKLFLIFNTMAFIFSLTTIFRGVETLARHRKKLDAGYVSRDLRASIRHCFVYFSFSTTFILAAFDQAGRAVMPPNQMWYITPIMWGLWGSWGLVSLFMSRKRIKRNFKGWWSRKWTQVTQLPKCIVSRL
jgi:ankyrin repeat protein